jgi:preprotein translocase subunit SecD
MVWRAGRSRAGRRRSATAALVVTLAAGVTVACGASENDELLGEDGSVSGFSATLVPREDASADQLDAAAEIIRARLVELGGDGIEVERDGDAITIEADDVDDPDRLLELATRPANLRIRPVLCELPSAADQEPPPGDATDAPDPTGTAGQGTDAVCDRFRAGTATAADLALTDPADDVPDAAVTLEQPGVATYRLGPARATVEGREVELTGEVFAGADATEHPPGAGVWNVVLALRGGWHGKAFNVLASSCFDLSPVCPDGRASMTLDGAVLNALGFQERSFAGEAVISGDFTETEATDLALALRIGALPVLLEVEKTTADD